MALDRILSRKRSEIERLHLNKLGQLNYYYRDEYGVFYEVAEDRRILRVSKLLNDWMTSIVDEGSATTVIQNIFGEIMPNGLSSQYWRGDKTWADFSSTVLSTTLTGFVVGTNTSITSSDSVLTAFENTQAQINAIIASLSGYVPTSRQLTINGVTWDLSADRTWSVGTVTSVDLSVPSIFSLSGNPITTSGTLTVTLANQTANTIFSGPSAGAPAAPTFRTLVAADIPSLSGTYWAQNGNSFGVTGVFGTTDNNDISIISNNTAYWAFYKSGSMWISDEPTTTAVSATAQATGHLYIGKSTTNPGVPGNLFLVRNAPISTAVGNITFANYAIAAAEKRVAVIQGQTTATATNYGQLNFYTMNAGTLTNKMTLGSTGILTVLNNNLVVSSGYVGIGGSAVTNQPITSAFALNGSLISYFSNTNNGTAAQSQIRVRNNSSLDAVMGIRSSGFTTAGILRANQAQFITTSTDSVLYGSSSTGESIFICGGTATTNEKLRIGSSAITVADAVNFVFNTTTGTKHGTATNQKQSFWNATPIVQPTTAVSASVFAANTSGIVNDTATFDGYTIGQIVKALRNIGLLA